jgi:hypothetical protein
MILVINLMICNLCNKTKTPNEFTVNKSGKLYKTCEECRVKQRCECNIRKQSCKIHGNSHCGCGIHKHSCKIHGNPNHFCECNILKHKCKKCCEDPIKLTVKNWLVNNKKTDEKTGRYIPELIINEKELYELIYEQTCCIYCGLENDFRDSGPTGVSIERIDNDIGHNMWNCTIACQSCNRARKNNYTHEEFIIKMKKKLHC